MKTGSDWTSSLSVKISLRLLKRWACSVFASAPLPASRPASSLSRHPTGMILSDERHLSQRTLVLEQGALAVQPAAVARERAVRADHAMARDHDRDRRAADAAAHRADVLVVVAADAVADLAVGNGL